MNLKAEENCFVFPSTPIFFSRKRNSWKHSHDKGLTAWLLFIQEAGDMARTPVFCFESVSTVSQQNNSNDGPSKITAMQTQPHLSVGSLRTQQGRTPASRQHPSKRILETGAGYGKTVILPPETAVDTVLCDEGGRSILASVRPQESRTQRLV